MAHLNLLAKTSCTSNPSDGVSNIFIFVQVTDENGDPVTGLVQKKFDVWRGMGAEQISFVAPQGVTNMPGIYAIALEKTLGSLKGQFVYTIRAKSGSGKRQAKGWTLADLVKL
jgi:hypothetical protein